MMNENTKLNANIDFMSTIDFIDFKYSKSKVNTLANYFSDKNDYARNSSLKLNIYNNGKLTDDAINAARPMASDVHISLNEYVNGLNEKAKKIFKYYALAFDGEDENGYIFMDILNTRYGSQIYSNSNIKYTTINGKFKYAKLNAVNNTKNIIILYDDIVVALANENDIKKAIKANEQVSTKMFKSRVYNKFKKEFSDLFIAIYTLETIK